MSVAIEAERPSIPIRRTSYEKASLVRMVVDKWFGLTDREFRVDGNLVIIGPLPSDDLVESLVEFLESVGLIYFDDFCELSDNWPQWLRVYVM